MSKKKAIAAILAIIMVLFCFAGCVSNSSEDSLTDNNSTDNDLAADNSSSNDSSNSSSEVEYKFTEAGGPDLGGITLTIGIQPNPFITSYEDNEFTRKLEEECNVNIEFFEFPTETEDFLTKLSLMASSGGDMPDVVNVPLSSIHVLQYGSRGLFIPLNDYVYNEKMSPNFAKIPEEDKKIILRATTAPDGNIYGLARYEPEIWNLTPYRYYINRAWLDTLGLDVPKTTDELRDVLRAFVNNDPNRNGKKDEIGAYGRSSGGYGENIIWALMNSFIYSNGVTLQLDENDSSKVIAPFTQDAWREGLQYMRELHEEGLLSASIFVDDATQFKATLNAETPIVGLVSLGSFGQNWPDSDNNPNFLQMECIEPFIGPKGVSWTPYTPYNPAVIWFITSSCEYPEEAYRLGEYFYDFTISMTNRFGREGYDWTSDPEICANYTNANVINGITDSVTLVYRYATEENVWTTNHNRSWQNAGPRYASLKFHLGYADGVTCKKDSFRADLPSQRPGIINALYYTNRHPKVVLPPLQYTLEEGEAIATPITDITTYVNTATAEFITGQRPLDDDSWQAYLDELNAMGLQLWIETTQAAYDRTINMNK